LKKEPEKKAFYDNTYFGLVDAMKEDEDNFEQKLVSYFRNFAS